MMQHAVSCLATPKGTQLGISLHLWLGLFGGPIVSSLSPESGLSSPAKLRSIKYLSTQPEKTNAQLIIPNVFPQVRADKVLLFDLQVSPSREKEGGKMGKRTCYSLLRVLNATTKCRLSAEQNANVHQRRECKKIEYILIT